jgi:hypothetical protein
MSASFLVHLSQVFQMVRITWAHLRRISATYTPPDVSTRSLIISVYIIANHVASPFMSEVRSRLLFQYSITLCPGIFILHTQY